MMDSAVVKFEASQRGLVDLRNESFIQKECLSVAQSVAAMASGTCGQPFRCDVQPGRSRCHARASCDVSSENKKDWYDGAYGQACDAALNAAISAGGEQSQYFTKGMKR